MPFVAGPLCKASTTDKTRWHGLPSQPFVYANTQHGFSATRLPHPPLRNTGTYCSGCYSYGTSNLHFHDGGKGVSLLNSGVNAVWHQPNLIRGPCFTQQTPVECNHVGEPRNYQLAATYNKQHTVFLHMQPPQTRRLPIQRGFQNYRSEPSSPYEYIVPRATYYKQSPGYGETLNVSTHGEGRFLEISTRHDLAIQLCRWISDATLCELHLVFKELQPHLIYLGFHSSGNYVVQRLLSHGGNDIRGSILTALLKDDPLLLRLSHDRHGSWVVQRMLEVSDQDRLELIISRLCFSPLGLDCDLDLLTCVQNQHGSHVILKAIERCWPNCLEPLTQKLQDHVPRLCHDRHAVRVIQRYVEYGHDATIARVVRVQTLQTMVPGSNGWNVLRSLMKCNPCGRQSVMDVALQKTPVLNAETRSNMIALYDVTAHRSRSLKTRRQDYKATGVPQFHEAINQQDVRMMLHISYDSSEHQLPTDTKGEACGHDVGPATVGLQVLPQPYESWQQDDRGLPIQTTNSQ